MEGVYSRRRYLGTKGEFRECNGLGGEVWRRYGEELRQATKEDYEEFCRRELPGRYTAKTLYV